MEKITKQAFKNYLLKYPTRFCGSIFHTDESKLFQSLENAGDPFLSSINPREVIHVQTNALQFSGGSWLYFEPFCQYFLYTAKSGKRFLLKYEGAENREDITNVIVYNF